MTTDIRITHPAKVVLGVLLDTPAQGRYGHELAKQTEINKNTVYRILARFEGRGWLTSTMIPSDVRGRPPRRYYQLTDQGQVAARWFVHAGARGTELS